MSPNVSEGGIKKTLLRLGKASSLKAMVPERGLEPLRLKLATDFKSVVSAIPPFRRKRKLQYNKKSLLRNVFFAVGRFSAQFLSFFRQEKRKSETTCG